MPLTLAPPSGKIRKEKSFSHTLSLQLIKILDYFLLSITDLRSSYLGSALRCAHSWINTAYFDLNVEKNYVKESEIESDMHQKLKDAILG